MLLEQTIHQLDIGHMPPERANRMGQFGYVQWLGSLDGNASYLGEALKAYDMAFPFAASSPAIAVFCRLLIDSVASPLVPLPIALTAQTRQGGAKTRRLSQ